MLKDLSGPCLLMLAFVPVQAKWSNVVWAKKLRRVQVKFRHKDAVEREMAAVAQMKEEETQRIVRRQAETMVKLEQEKNAAQA